MSATDSGIVIPGQRPIHPQQPLTVTLEAQQWEQVLRILDETPAPHRVTHPLIQAIQQQCLRQADAPAMRGNGISTEERTEP